MRLYAFLLSAKTDMATNPRPPRRRGALLTAASAPGVIGMLIVVDRPLLDLLIVIAGGALPLIGYVITASSDRPFHRVYALLSLVLQRGTEGEPAQGSRSDHAD